MSLNTTIIVFVNKLPSCFQLEVVTSFIINRILRYYYKHQQYSILELVKKKINELEGWSKSNYMLVELS